MLKREMPPVHPGEILQEMYLEPLNISITDLAKSLKVARRTISLIINGHSGISVEMALRLSTAFSTTVEYWLNLQRTYDVWNVSRKINVSNIKHLIPATKATRPAKRA